MKVSIFKTPLGQWGKEPTEDEVKAYLRDNKGFKNVNLGVISSAVVSGVGMVLAGFGLSQQSRLAITLGLSAFIFGLGGSALLWAMRILPLSSPPAASTTDGEGGASKVDQKNGSSSLSETNQSTPSGDKKTKEDKKKVFIEKLLSAKTDTEIQQLRRENETESFSKKKILSSEAFGYINEYLSIEKANIGKDFENEDDLTFRGIKNAISLIGDDNVFYCGTVSGNSCDTLLKVATNTNAHPSLRVHAVRQLTKSDRVSSTTLSDLIKILERKDTSPKTWKLGGETTFRSELANMLDSLYEKESVREGVLFSYNLSSVFVDCINDRNEPLELRRTAARSIIRERFKHSFKSWDENPINELVACLQGKDSPKELKEEILKSLVEYVNPENNLKYYEENLSTCVQAIDDKLIDQEILSKAKTLFKGMKEKSTDQYHQERVREYMATIRNQTKSLYERESAIVGLAFFGGSDRAILACNELISFITDESQISPINNNFKLMKFAAKQLKTEFESLRLYPTSLKNFQFEKINTKSLIDFINNSQHIDLKIEMLSILGFINRYSPNEEITNLFLKLSLDKSAPDMIRKAASKQLSLWAITLDPYADTNATKYASQTNRILDYLRANVKTSDSENRDDLSTLLRVVGDLYRSTEDSRILDFLIEHFDSVTQSDLKADIAHELGRTGQERALEKLFTALNNDGDLLAQIAAAKGLKGAASFISPSIRDQFAWLVPGGHSYVHNYIEKKDRVLNSLKPLLDKLCDDKTNESVKVHTLNSLAEFVFGISKYAINNSKDPRIQQLKQSIDRLRSVKFSENEQYSRYLLEDLIQHISGVKEEREHKKYKYFDPKVVREHLKTLEFTEEENPTKSQVHSRYRKLAIKYNLDQRPTAREEEKTICIKKFKEINEAWEYLDDFFDNQNEENTATPNSTQPPTKPATSFGIGKKI